MIFVKISQNFIKSPLKNYKFLTTTEGSFYFFCTFFVPDIFERNMKFA